MSTDVGIIFGLLIAFGSVAVVLLLYYLSYKIAIKCYEKYGKPPTPEEPTPVEEVVRPQRSQYLDITVRFFEEFGINGYERDPVVDRQIEAARENRVRPNDVLPEYHEVADSNLPSYHEAINVVKTTSVCRIENERY